MPVSKFDVWDLLLGVVLSATINMKPQILLFTKKNLLGNFVVLIKDSFIPNAAINLGNTILKLCNVQITVANDNYTNSNDFRFS